MNNKLMREGLTKFIESIELQISEESREKILDNLEKLWSDVLLSGYAQDPWSALGTQDHFLPFSGFVSIGYIPGNEIVGLSNIGKLVHILCARLHLQESLTSEIADVIYKSINPAAVGVYMVAQHYCMKARFPAQNVTEVITTSFRGDYKSGNFREEFLRIVKKGGDEHV